MNQQIVKEVLIENDIVSLWYYPEKKIIYHSIHKFLYGDLFQEVMLKGLDYFEKKGCQKWLSDDRSNSVLRKQDTAWGEINWKPRMIKAGWKYWALLLPDRAIGKLSMKGLIEEYKELGVVVEIFDNIDQGFKWLDSK